MTDPKPYVPPFSIAIDFREQAPWRFSGMVAPKSKGGGVVLVNVASGVNLATGDYSIVGCEDRFAIERKSKSDLYGSLGHDRERFEREMVRLNDIGKSPVCFAAVIVEADWTLLLEVPPAFTRMRPESIEGTILAWSVRYSGVHWFLCESRRHAEYRAFRLMEFWWKENGA